MTIDVQPARPIAHQRTFLWPDGFRRRVHAIHRSNVALRAGRELIEQGTYRFRAFPPVAIDLFEHWTENPVANRSWQWHSASFNFMPWLIALHANTGDQRAIDHAAKGIESWHQRFVAIDSDYEFAWHDHATANRLMGVLSLLCHLEEHPACFDLGDMLPVFLAAHGDRLCMEEMYSRHTNHGIDQSRALLLLATCAPWLGYADRWREVAISRLEDELGHAFADDGAHVENSPGYHQFVSNLFTDVLATFGETLDPGFRARIQSTLTRAAGYMAWIVRPDGRFPPIGDTECKPAINVYHTLAGTPEHANMQWVCSGAREGLKPVGWAKTFPDAGYFIARNDWGNEETLPGDACHLVFRCGRVSGYHRHDDDLSLTFWWGSDWLLDGGAYAYVEEDPVRRYLRSKWGHNVVVVDHGDYTWARPGAGAAGMLRQTDDSPDRPVVQGETRSYPGLSATRELLVDRGCLRFEVVDRLSATGSDADSGGSRKFVSLWHVPSDKTISVEGQSVRISDPAFLREMVIRNLGEDFDRIHVVEALPNGDVPVWSRELNKLERCKVVAFERSGERFESRLEFRLEDRRPEHRHPGDTNAKVRGLWRSYCHDPAGWWPPQGLHHARKISSRLVQATKEGLPGDAFLEELYAMAVVRQGSRKPTLHLSNMGYPDAALVEPRLRAALGMLPAGEVYLPAPVQRLIRDWPDADRLLFVDAVHLLHAGARPGSGILNTVVNSSQGQHQELLWRGDDAVRVLATRNPVDSALNALARGRPKSGWASRREAEAALARQVERLTRFAAWVGRQQFAMVFRMEDFAGNPRPALQKISDLCRLPLDEAVKSALPRIEPLSETRSGAELVAFHGIPARAMLQEQLESVAHVLDYD